MIRIAILKRTKNLEVLTEPQLFTFNLAVGSLTILRVDIGWSPVREEAEA